MAPVFIERIYSYVRSSLDELLERQCLLQAELKEDIGRLLEEKRQLFHYTIEQGKVRFEQGIKALQKRQKIGSWTYLHRNNLCTP